MKSVFLSALLGAVLVLSGCSDDVKKPLSGERLSVLQLQTALTPSPDLDPSSLVLPTSWTNQFWPQAGGYPNHAMGHLDLGGEISRAWTRSIGKGGSRRRPLVAAPVVAEGMVFALDAAGHMTALDAQTGARRWQVRVVPRGEGDKGAAGGGIAYASGRLYVTNGYHFVTAFNPKDGAMLWRTRLPAPARSAPTVMDERVYLVTLDNRLMVFAAADGVPVWNYAGVSEATNLMGTAAPAVDERLVVLPLSSGELFGLRPENGRIVWEDNLSAVRRLGALSAISDIRGLPVIDQGVVYALSYSGRMVALDQVTGRRLWQREIGGSETPWAAGPVVFVLTSEQDIVALARDGGDVYWVSALPRYEDEGKRENPIVWTGPVLAGERLFVASNQGRLREIDPFSGKMIAEHKLPAGVTVPMVVAGKTLYILTAGGDLVAWR